jgi:hypothetical protein
MGRFYKTTSIPTIDYSYKYPFEELLRASQYKQARQDKAVQDLYTAKDKLLNIDYVPDTEDEVYLKQKQAQYDDLLNQASQMDLSGGTAWLNRQIDDYVGDPRLADIASNALTAKALKAQKDQLMMSGKYDPRNEIDVVSMINQFPEGTTRLPMDLSYRAVVDSQELTKGFFDDLKDNPIAFDLNKLLAYAGGAASENAANNAEFLLYLQNQYPDLDINNKQEVLEKVKPIMNKAALEFYELYGGGSGANGPNGPNGDPTDSANSFYIQEVVNPVGQGRKANVPKEMLEKTVLGTYNTAGDYYNYTMPTDNPIYANPTITKSGSTSMEEDVENLHLTALDMFYNSEEYLDLEGSSNPEEETKLIEELKKKAELIDLDTGINPFDATDAQTMLKKHPFYEANKHKVEKYRGVQDFFLNLQKGNAKGQNVGFRPKVGGDGNYTLVNGIPYMEGTLVFTQEQGNLMFGEQSVLGIMGDDWVDQLVVGETNGLYEDSKNLIVKKGEYYEMPVRVPAGTDIFSSAAIYDRAADPSNNRKVNPNLRTGEIAGILKNINQKQAEQQIVFSNKYNKQVVKERLTLDPGQDPAKITSVWNAYKERTEKFLNALEMSSDKKEKILEIFSTNQQDIINQNSTAIDDFSNFWANSIQPLAQAYKVAKNTAIKNNVSDDDFALTKTTYKELLERQLGLVGVEGFSSGDPTSPDTYGISSDYKRIDNPTVYNESMKNWAVSKGLKEAPSPSSYSNLNWNTGVQSISDILGDKISSPYLSTKGLEILDGLNNFAKSKGLNTTVFGMARPEITQRILAENGADVGDKTQTVHSAGNAIDLDIPESMQKELATYFNNLGIPVKVIYHDNHMHVAYDSPS